jgi:hypothetical protein
MYLIVKEYKHWKEVVAETPDAAEAYELAHRHSAERADPEDPHIITIKDENGTDLWDYCARMRCPSKGGLFQ